MIHEQDPMKGTVWWEKVLFIPWDIFLCNPLDIILSNEITQSTMLYVFIFQMGQEPIRMKLKPKKQETQQKDAEHKAYTTGLEICQDKKVHNTLNSFEISWTWKIITYLVLWGFFVMTC